jgi:hypothetical protein
LSLGDRGIHRIGCADRVPIRVRQKPQIREMPMNTRTIAIIALAIAVIVLIILLT